MIASRIPRFLSSFARFRKKLIVIGIMGQMQGMTRAKRPPMMPIRKIYHKECPMISLVPPNDFSSLTTGFHHESVFDGEREATVAAESTRAVVSSRLCKAAAASESALVLGRAAVAAGSGLASFLFSSGRAVASKAGDLPDCLMLTSCGGRQLSSLQVPYSR